MTASCLFIVDDRARVKLTRIVFPGSIEKLLGGEQHGCRRQHMRTRKNRVESYFPSFSKCSMTTSTLVSSSKLLHDYEIPSR